MDVYLISIYKNFLSARLNPHNMNVKQRESDNFTVEPNLIIPIQTVL